MRPYYSVHERHLVATYVRALQHKRRTAAALARLGIDYDADLVHDLAAPPLPAALAGRTSKELAHG